MTSQSACMLTARAKKEILATYWTSHAGSERRHRLRLREDHGPRDAFINETAAAVKRICGHEAPLVANREFALVSGAKP